MLLQPPAVRFSIACLGDPEEDLRTRILDEFQALLGASRQQQRANLIKDCGDRLHVLPPRVSSLSTTRLVQMSTHA